MQINLSLSQQASSTFWETQIWDKTSNSHHTKLMPSKCLGPFHESQASVTQ